MRRALALDFLWTTLLLTTCSCAFEKYNSLPWLALQRPACYAAHVPRTPRIEIVGPGNLGSALALALCNAGYRITEIIFRDTGGSKRLAQGLARKVGATAVSIGKSSLDADVIWLCVPDGAITDVSRLLAQRREVAWKDKVAFHSSGALRAQELLPLQRKGTGVASVHPLMTFVAAAGKSASTQKLAGVPFAIESSTVLFCFFIVDMSTLAVGRKWSRC